MEELKPNKHLASTESPKAVDRRRFLKQAGTLLAGGGLMSLWPQELLAEEKNLARVTILHTNDVHSRIEPFPMDGSRNQGLGGAARRATLIQKLRKEEKNVLLFDAGDAVQGTPYFNLFDGQLEMELMNKMGYDAATFGNHEFDNGLEHLAKMVDHAQFPFLNSNYDFAGTPMEGKSSAYQIFNKSGIKIGVFGLGIELDGLVDPLLAGGVRYNYPIAVANEMANRLKNVHKCDLVICLSHLGYRYQGNKVSDRVLAAETKDIDLIIGGHTHTFLAEPEQVKNLSGHTTIINQVGFGGINLGRIDFVFEKRTGRKQMIAQNYVISDRVLA
ncbi:MAG TPA: metallophosphatase [Sphingobacteriaceae bacterium]|nr:metallophosphatase [Sphingobacteriaceae bacterium]